MDNHLINGFLNAIFQYQINIILSTEKKIIDFSMKGQLILKIMKKKTSKYPDNN